jgi:hypothetical protein
MWTVAGILGVAVLAAIGVFQSVRWKVSRHVAGRQKLSDSEFAEKYFPAEQRETAVKLRRMLETYIPVNVNLVQPQDRLVDDLGLAARFSCGLDVVSFVQDIEDEFKVEFGEEDYLQMQTFHDAVEIVFGKTALTTSHS